MEIRTAADADVIRDDIEQVYDGWYAQASRVDWVDFLDRLEGMGHDLGDSMVSPAVNRIKRIVSDLRKE